MNLTIVNKTASQKAFNIVEDRLGRFLNEKQLLQVSQVLCEFLSYYLSSSRKLKEFDRETFDGCVTYCLTYGRLKFMMNQVDLMKLEALLMEFISTYINHESKEVL